MVVSYNGSHLHRARGSRMMTPRSNEIAVAFSDGEPAPGAARVHDRISAETAFAERSPTQSRSRLRVVARQRFPRSITISRNSSIDSQAEGVIATLYARKIEQEASFLRVFLVAALLGTGHTLIQIVCHSRHYYKSNREKLNELGFYFLCVAC